MTFLAELERLEKEATNGPFYSGHMKSPDGNAMAWHGNWYVDTKAPKVMGSRYRDPESDARLHSFLRNHSQAIAELVRAAGYYANNYLLDEKDDVRLCFDEKQHRHINELFEALAKLDQQEAG